MSVVALGSFEDLEKVMKAADARVEPWQKEIKPGDVVVVFAGSLEDPVVSFCRIERMVHSKGCENYREAKVFSIYVPDGEIENIHVSSAVEVIDEEMFAEAMKVEWSPTVCGQWMSEGRMKV